MNRDNNASSMAQLERYTESMKMNKQKGNIRNEEKDNNNNNNNNNNNTFRNMNRDDNSSSMAQLERYTETMHMDKEKRNEEKEYNNNNNNNNTNKDYDKGMNRDNNTSSMAQLEKYTESMNKDNKIINPLKNIKVPIATQNIDRNSYPDSITLETTNRETKDNSEFLSSFESPKPGFNRSNKEQSLGVDINTMSMIHLDKLVTMFEPLGTWQEKKTNFNQQPSSFHISTSFLPCGIKLRCPSTTDVIVITGIGIEALKILFSKDSLLKKDDGGQVNIKEISIPQQENEIQTVSISTPFSCTKIEILIKKQNQEDFICIFNVQAFAQSSRSSALSTPIMVKRDDSLQMYKNSKGMGKIHNYSV